MKSPCRPSTCSWPATASDPDRNTSAGNFPTACRREDSYKDRAYQTAPRALDLNNPLNYRLEMIRSELAHHP